MLKRLLKYKLLFLFTILFMLGGIQLITAYFFSKKTEIILNHQFKIMTKSSLIDVISYKYNYGLFISHCDVELKINNKSLNLLNILSNNSPDAKNTMFKVKYHSNIKSGIFTGLFFGYFRPTLAVIDTQIEFESSLSKTLSKFFNKQQPLNIKNIINLDKSGEFIITSPQFDYDEELSKVNLHWGGVHINVNYNNDFNNFNKVITLPYIKFNIPTKLNINLNQFNYDSNIILSNHNIYVGNTNFTLDNLFLQVESSALPSIKITNILNSLIGIKVNDFLEDFNLSNNYKFNLLNLKYQTSSYDKNNYFASYAKINIESIMFNNYFFGLLNIDFETSHINSIAFSKLLNFFADYPDDNNYETKNRFVESLKYYFTPVLIDTPVIKLNKLTVLTNKGLISIDGMVTTKSFESIDISSQDLFFSKIYFTTHFSIPKDVFSYLMMMQMKYFLSFGNTDIDKQSYQALSEVINILLSNQIKVWKKRRYIKENNGVVSSSIIFDQNNLLVTDK
jgi:uncharacterized protein YdgA (DUF945 family)